MKALLTIVSVAALISTVASAEMPSVNQERVEAQHEVQNRFKEMKTDDLLEKRGTMTSQQEREQLHSELMNREKTMSKEQKEKFMKKPDDRTPKMKNKGDGKGMMKGKGTKGQMDQEMGNTPEKISQEMGTQGKGMGYGQDQGMTQGKRSGLGNGMGGGKGGR